MPLSTVIRQNTTDIRYHMQLVFDKNRSVYVLQFLNMGLYGTPSESHEYQSFGEALSRYRSNCRAYHVPEPSSITEEEFLGIPRGVLAPVRKGGRK